MTAALDACNHAPALFQQVGDRPGEANTRRSFGQLHHARKEYAEAGAAFEAAIAGHANIADHYSITLDLYYFSFTQEAMGQAAKAVQSLERALHTCWQLALPWTNLVVQCLFMLKDMSEDDFQKYLATLAQSRGRNSMKREAI
ncbi:MAG: hypothetical protein ONB48_11685 [candidate division KSB1 bacterium]|nr:hypothetical protein [candidate division KSB1 bacterium]MDZ7275383.1 hypothetical protein [candidate division KSB1 bacterium]MDZ7286304.1 hypothetical protein [candidate division KSB1 bacterium]MDZ7296531.1 hypothetical protein [candidate division KSB1 bacterium]MDZ7309150.1 hypothetical protein [candidate division KSB1 bacterium]